MARDTVLAHLLKLQHEGRAGRGAAAAPGASAPKEDAWHIIEP
jgi:hypothetical protein